MNTIKLKSYLNIQEEAVATGAITPGNLLAIGASGVANHAVASGNAQPIFAFEDELQGKTISDDYAIGDLVQILYPTPGDEVYANLATSQTIVAGDFLESAGNGALQKHVDYTTTVDEGGTATVVVTVPARPIVAVATEAVTTTSSLGRIKAKII